MPPAASPLHALLDRYERPLVRYALSIVGDLESARDVVQDTFIRWCRVQESGDGNQEPEVRSHGAGSNGRDVPVEPSAPPESCPLTPDSSSAWLFTVTRNRALDVLRKNRRIVPMTLPDDRPCEALAPDAALASRDAEHTLLALLDALSPNQREVIRLKFQNDLSYREIAEVTQLTETNVGFLLHTGLKKLRALVAERAAEDFGHPIRQAL